MPGHLSPGIFHDHPHIDNRRIAMRKPYVSDAQMPQRAARRASTILRVTTFRTTTCRDVLPEGLPHISP